MTFSRQRCPECDGTDTERVDIVFETDYVIEVRACDECYAGYEIEYVDPVAIVTQVGDDQ